MIRLFLPRSYIPPSSYSASPGDDRREHRSHERSRRSRTRDRTEAPGILLVQAKGCQPMKLDQAILKIMEGFEVPYESISPS